MSHQNLNQLQTPPPEGRCKLACEECRKRKLRCDGRQPQCGVCFEAGISCRVNLKRSARGPKKGLLKSLRVKAAKLQRRLQAHEGELSLNNVAISLDNRTDGINEGMIASPEYDPCLPIASDAILPETSLVGDLDYGVQLISDLVQADLNEIYFERVHPFAPFIQKHCFLLKASQPTPKGSRVCLQLSMWALAASLSIQHQSIGDALYQRTRNELERLEQHDTGFSCVDLQQAQAWILVSLFELIRKHYQMGWISIGRTCRLIQLMGLHRFDSTGNGTEFDEAIYRETTEAEEKRRTFWTAYCLDRLVSTRNNWPLAFNELVICTRLPTSEQHFQDGEASLGGFLSEEIAANCDHCMTPLTELIVIATICGRCLAHKQQAAVELVYGGSSHDFWERHDWLHSLLQRNLAMLSRVPASFTNNTHPVHLFANMVANACLIYLFKIPGSLPLESGKRRDMAAYFEQARVAALGIADLSQYCDEIGMFKIHPLTPFPIFCTAEFFMQQDTLAVPHEPQIQKLVAVLQNLKPVNQLAEHYLDLLRPSWRRTHVNS